MISKSYDVVKSLWESLDLPADLPERHLRLTGDPSCTLASSFNLGLAAQLRWASIAVAGLATCHVHALSTGEVRTVSVNARHAALEFCSEKYYTINGTAPGEIWDNLAGTYPTKHNSFVRIHTNFPQYVISALLKFLLNVDVICPSCSHREGILSILNLPSTTTREAVGQALVNWDSKEFEDEVARNGICATAMRPFEEWDKHPHAQSIRDTPPVQLIKISDAPKRKPFDAAHNKGALEGVRVLDLTRIIAGPVCGRTLAAHGADVLLVTSPNLPSLPNLDADMSRGKRTTQLDLTSDVDRDKLVSLIEESDVFLQNYRPGAIAEKGLGVTDLAKIRPGIVCANLTAWGWEGSWKDRRGFDSLVQTASGFNVDEANAFAKFRGEPDPATKPKALPLQALDHAAGHLLAFGVAAALCKAMTTSVPHVALPSQGSTRGSWEVRVSLACIGNWIRSLGRLGEDGFRDAMALPKRTYPPDEEILQLSSLFRIPKSPRGGWTAAERAAPVAEQRGSDQDDTMLALRHSAVLENTLWRVTEAPVRLNLDFPMWLPRS